ncbi:hypothetical protein KBC70_04535 [Candidatus Woesebacteria bacterium]|nr:hypothetical protein [Candidatus Woesebacteria bacterium]
MEVDVMNDVLFFFSLISGSSGILYALNVKNQALGVTSVILCTLTLGIARVADAKALGVIIAILCVGSLITLSRVKPTHNVSTEK